MSVNRQKPEAMKTEWTSSPKSSHCYLTLFMAMLLTCIGCTESDHVDPIPQSFEEEYLNFRVLTEQYWVDPDGTTIGAFNGGVTLGFPEGAVAEPTLFTLASFPLHRLERKGYHLMNRGFSITPESENEQINNLLQHYVKIKMCVDSDLCAGIKGTYESAITIFYLNDCGGENERIELMCKCVRDHSGNSFHGCIYCCGTYVIGES
jgi:hypothetical protein